MASILTEFYEWTGRDPDTLLYAFLDGDGRVTESRTYAQFLQRTSDIAAHIRRAHPMPPGERVLLIYPPGIEMIAAFFACVRLGLIPVPVYPPGNHGFEAALARADFVASDCQAAAVLTERAYYWSMRLNEARNHMARLSFRRRGISSLRWIASTDAEIGTQGGFPEAHSDVVFLQYTSGSTSDPRGVMVTHENMIDNCNAVVDHRPIGVSWLPQYHDMGLIGYYVDFALKGGTTYGFSPIDFIRRPSLWLETISRYRGTASSAPNFAYEYCLRPDKIAPETLEHLDLSSLRFLMTAAEPVRPDVCREFVRRFQPCGLNPGSFFAAYGLAEFTLAVSNYGRVIQSFDAEALQRHEVEPAPGRASPGIARTLVSCGRPLGATEVKIVDVTSAPREAGEHQAGEIWIRGPSKCRGYWGRPELTATTFEARLPGEAPGAPTWLRSGDVGFLHDGELYVCGRLKDLIIVRGQNHYPQDIEAIVETDERVRKGCVAAFASEHDDGEGVVVVAEVKDARHLPDARALNRRLATELGVAAESFVFIEARTIPKTSSGKIARHAVRERWQAGGLRVVGQAEGDAAAALAITGGSRPWLRGFGLTGTETCTLEAAGLDSLRLVEFSHAIQREVEQYGDDGVPQAIDLRVLQKIVVAELFELLDQVAAAAPYARLRLKQALEDIGREHGALEAELMRRDSRLRSDIAALPPDRPRVGPEGGVLLTGGTGFFGPFLLASLLEQCQDPVYVLVRGGDDDVMPRIREGLQAISVDGACPPGWEFRVRPVRGDLAAPNLGLSAAAWDRLANEVHTVYHNAALVNYLLNYEAMREPNVGGTNEVVRLAMSGRAKVLNHISTTFVFGWSVKETLFERDRNADMERLDFGYSQSKWVAEQVVFEAMANGLQARVFRPALLTPSVHGGGRNLDIAIRLLAFMINHGISTTARNQVSFCPADLAATNIVAISGIPASLGATVHVTRDQYATLADVTDIVRERTGRSFRYHALPDFVPEVIRRCHTGDVLFPLLEFLVRSVDSISAMEFKRYDNSTYRKWRDASPFGRPDPPLTDVVLGILRFLHRHDLVTEAPWSVPRTGQVEDGARV